MLDPRLFWSWGLHPGFLLGPPRANLQSSYEILFLLFCFVFFLFKERRERKGVLTIIILPYIHTHSLKREREMKIMTWMHTAKIMNAQTLLECGRRLTFFFFLFFFFKYLESQQRAVDEKFCLFFLLSTHGY
jgi:hypothetical protein